MKLPLAKNWQSLKITHCSLLSVFKLPLNQLIRITFPSYFKIIRHTIIYSNNKSESISFSETKIEKLSDQWFCAAYCQNFHLKS